MRGLWLITKYVPVPSTYTPSVRISALGGGNPNATMPHDRVGESTPLHRDASLGNMVKTSLRFMKMKCLKTNAVLLEGLHLLPPTSLNH
jgi:hypothetical protein